MKRSSSSADLDRPNLSDIPLAPNTANTNSRRSSRVAAKRQKTEETDRKDDEVNDGNSQPQMAASHSNQNTQAPVHQNLGQINHPIAPANSQTGINTQPHMNNRAQSHGQGRNNQANNGGPANFTPGSHNQVIHAQSPAQGPVVPGHGVASQGAP